MKLQAGRREIRSANQEVMELASITQTTAHPRCMRPTCVGGPGTGNVASVSTLSMCLVKNTACCIVTANCVSFCS